MASNIQSAVLTSGAEHLEVSMDDILNSIVPFECLDEILELVDLGKRREATLYSDEYKDAISAYIINFDFKNKDLSQFDQFIMQLVLTGSSLKEQSLIFYKNLNRLAVATINGLYALKSSNLKTQGAMYHMQMTAGEASLRINELEESDFFLNKARQHFVMAVNFVSEMSLHKAFEAQSRVSDVDVLLLLNHNNAQTVEQAIVDTHNAVEYGKPINHIGLGLLLERYSDLCDLLSDFRPEERAYWTEFSVDLKAQSEEYAARVSG